MGNNEDRLNPARAVVASPELDAFGEVLSKTLHKIETIAGSVFETLVNIGRFIEEHHAEIDAFLSFMERHRKQFEDLEETQQKALVTLNQYGWLLSPSSFPEMLPIVIARIAEEPGDQSKAIDDLFVSYYYGNDFENLDTAVDSWATNPLFAPRMHIFKSSLISLRNQADNYNPSDVVVPALISQIDGVITAFLATLGYTYDPAKRKWIDPKGNVLTMKDTVWKKQQVDVSAADTEMWLSDDMKAFANEYIFNKLFETTYTFQPIPSIFNRHKIMHGEDTTYGTTANTIRAFLILDFLASLK